MGSPVPPLSVSRFNLDSTVLIPGSATALEVGATTSADVLQAIADDREFPRRRIDLASLSLEAHGGGEFRFLGGEGEASFSASGSARVRAGVFDKGTEVLAALALDGGQDVGFELADEQGTRYLLLLAVYEARGKLGAKHPIGVVGSASLGVEGERTRRYAVVHRFPADQGARTALRDTITSWKLPRHVTEAARIRPATHLIAEVEGSLAVRLGSQLGYDFNFVREARALGLQGDIGLKLEAGAKALIGLDVSGRYLLLLSREAADETLRLRLFKLKKKGLAFGLNIKATVQPEVDILPDNVDDLVKAVFGLHGRQIVKDLLLVEKWTDPKSDLSDTAAGLVNKTGLELLETVTGVNPKTAFSKARKVLLDAIRRWEELPSAVSSFLWSELEGAGLKGNPLKQFESVLKLLAAADAETRRKEIVRLLSAAGFENDIAGRFLIAAADKGLPALLDQSDEIRRAATLALDVLNGGVIEKLQGFISERLNLNDVLGAVKKADFDRLDGWLVQRLSNFFDQKLRFEDLDKVKDALHMVLGKRKEIYDRALQATRRRYDFDLAFRHQSSGVKTALIDVGFDTAQPAARTLLQEVLEQNLDRLLTTPTAGVTVSEAVLSHQITRQSSIEVQMPFYSAKTTNLTQSLARVAAQEDGGRVLFYELEAKDEVLKDRLKSQLGVAAALPLNLGKGVRLHGTPKGEWAYQFAQIAPKIRRPELESRISPMILEYFPDHFREGGQASLSNFLTDFDRAVEEVAGHPTDEFGDLLLSLEISLPGGVMGSWFRQRTKDQVKADARAVSIRVQKSLQRLIPFYYLRDLDRLHQNGETSPLLVFAAMPAVNQFRIDRDQMIPADGPIWDVFDPDKRAFMVALPATAGQLGSLLAAERTRLLAAGRTSQASFFRPEETGDFLRGVSDHPNFINLLRLVSVIAHGVEEALKDLSAFAAEAAIQPSRAIARLAEFGADVVGTFNRELSSVYGGDMVRPLGSMLFLEAACALDSTIATLKPNALLSMTVLKEERQFLMEDFLRNKMPRAEDVAVQQRLVSAVV